MVSNTFIKLKDGNWAIRVTERVKKNSNVIVLKADGSLVSVHLKARISHDKFAEIWAFSHVTEIYPDNKNILQLETVKELRLAHDALRLAREKRRQAEKLAAEEVNRQVYDALRRSKGL